MSFRGAYRVKHLIEDVTSWRQDGYVDADVWERLRERVNPELIEEALHSPPNVDRCCLFYENLPPPQIM